MIRMIKITNLDQNIYQNNFENYSDIDKIIVSFTLNVKLSKRRSNRVFGDCSFWKFTPMG